MDVDSEDEDSLSQGAPSAKFPKLDTSNLNTSSGLAQFIAAAQKNLGTNGLINSSGNAGLGSSNTSPYTYQVTNIQNSRLNNSKILPSPGTVVNQNGSTLGGSNKQNNQILCQYRECLK